MSEIVFSSWGEKIVDNRDKSIDDFEPLIDTKLPERFNRNKGIKALMGWYGILLRSEDVNMIDLCKAHMENVKNSSCGKCNPCRTGTVQISEILSRIAAGQAVADDLTELTELAEYVTQGSRCYIGQSGPVPLIHALNYFSTDFQKMLAPSAPAPSAEYESTVTAPCMDACPIHLDIPTYVEHIKEGRFDKAVDVIKERLPIPGIVGRVCFRPCEEHCRRANLDEPISIKFLKRFVADDELAMGRAPRFVKNPSPKTGSIAVIGSGPAGVTCAYHLALMGHDVTVYEKLGEPGGMSAVGIPDYRLPRDILQGETHDIEKLGVKIHYNTDIGKDIKLSRLNRDFDAVFVAIGCHTSMAMRVEGEDAGYKGMIPGVKFLLDVNSGVDPYPEGKRVVVIGGGNVAIDCVRCAFRVDKDDVTLLYRRTKKEMPADPVEIKDAEDENVKFKYLTAPVRIVAEEGKVVGIECLRMELGKPDDSGRRRPVPVEGSEFVIDCDIVVPAIGQRADLYLLEGGEKFKITRWDTFEVDEITKQTEQSNVFSAGDCETGPGALITACAGARKAAFSIDRMINGKELKPDTEDHFDALLNSVKVYDPKENLGVMGRAARKQLSHIPPDERKTTFVEVEQGFSNPDAIAEASRCLRCYSVVTVAVDEPVEEGAS